MLSFQEDLLNILNDSELPLPKRLKIANKTYKSHDLPLQRKEALLLKWLLEQPNDLSSWKLLFSWLSDDTFKHLNRNELKTDDILAIVQLLGTAIDGASIPDSKLLSQSVYALLENRTLFQCLKVNINSYFTLVRNFIPQIDCQQVFIEFIKNEHVFNKKLTDRDDFVQQFLANLFPELVRSVNKFNTPTVTNTVSSLVEKLVFQHNIAAIDETINQYFEKKAPKSKNPVGRILLKHLIETYDSDETLACTSFKLLFSAFCKSSSFYGIHRLFIICTEIIGFNTNLCNGSHKKSLKNTEINLNKSLKILEHILQTINDSKCDLEHKIKETTFSDLIQNLLKSIIFCSKPSSISYNIFNAVIAINPLIIEAIINEIIVYSMLNDNKNQLNEYEQLLISIFDVFAKLHRIPNFIAKAIPTIKSALHGEKFFSEVYKFRAEQNEIEECDDLNSDSILPENVLKSFTKCITNLASWQTINVLKTIVHHFNLAVDDIPNIEEGSKQLLYVEILSTLLCWLFRSVRLAEHTVTQIVVDKFVKSLDELKATLKKFGSALLNREHDHVLMRSFLNVSYNWGEIYLVLAYYSMGKEVELSTSLDNDFTACNITYLHSYLSGKEWCLIAERINNFGEKPCKQLMNKLAVQRMRGMMLFEGEVNEDVSTNVVEALTLNLGDNWRNIVDDKYTASNLIKRMNVATILFLAEELINQSGVNANCIIDCNVLLNGVCYVILMRMSKMLSRQKRKRDESEKKCKSAEVFENIDKEAFVYDKIDDGQVDLLKGLLVLKQEKLDLNVHEELVQNLESLKRFPVIFCSKQVQKIVLLYLFALHNDVCNSNNGEMMKTNCECLIIGILQNAKFNVWEVVDVTTVCGYVINNFVQYEKVFTLILKKVLKHLNEIHDFEQTIKVLSKNFSDSKHLQCFVIVLNEIQKMKNQKTGAEVQTSLNSYKSTLTSKIVKFINGNKVNNDLIEAFAVALKISCSKDENNNLSLLLNKLKAYIKIALAPGEEFRGQLVLFGTVLENKSQIKKFNNELPLIVWNWVKEIKSESVECDLYSPLVVLVFQRIANKRFAHVTDDFLKLTVRCIEERNKGMVVKRLETWKSLLFSDFSPNKVKILTTALEAVAHELIKLQKTSDFDEDLYDSMFKFIQVLVQNTQVHLTPSLIDSLLMNVTILINKPSTEGNFQKMFSLCVKTLELLMKSRKALIMDRLPSFLQQYRFLLKKLCKRSNSNEVIGENNVQKLSDCAHQLERLTIWLVSCEKDMARIAMYLIADILGYYEEITIYPSVKMHLNNCIYSLISLCDQHAIAFLMRVLSSASTELFKVMHEHYNKYYKFTGKV